MKSNVWKDPEEERFENLKSQFKWTNETEDDEVEDLWQKEILNEAAKKAEKKAAKKLSKATYLHIMYIKF